MSGCVCGGMSWPARCLDCGFTTEDPDAWVVVDSEVEPERCCPLTGGEHRWATAVQALTAERDAALRTNAELVRSGGAVAWVNEANETGDHHPYADASHIAACTPERILALCAVVAAADADHRTEDGDEPHAEGCCAVCDALAALEATP